MAQTKVWEQNRRDAKRFAREVEAGVTYWVIEEAVQPWGNEPIANDYVFEKKALLGLMSGSMSPERLVLTYGPVYDTQPRGMRTMRGSGSQLFKPFGGDTSTRSLEDDAYPELVRAEARRKQRGRAGARR
ncbi:hypothetical protein AB0M94_38895 [Streptomyces xanthochromogenes]|uniref:hypothetical protein n=1 Tax=Streptomyces xanthochromogenes TaxID=67384 RepID=UPI0034250C31